MVELESVNNNKMEANEHMAGCVDKEKKINPHFVK